MKSLAVEYTKARPDPLGRLSAKVGRALRVSRALLQAATRSHLRRDLFARLLEYQEFAYLTRCIQVPPKCTVSPAQGSAPFSLLVTTEKGLFLLSKDRWRCLLPVTCFGVARHGDTLYLGASAGIYSWVLAARLGGDTAECVLGEIQVLARYETRYHNERIHQIAYDSNRHQVICANCRRNSLLIVDARGGGIIDEKFLFVDGTGFPVYTDQNHINSVTPNGDVLLFTAHSAGSAGGALGFVSNDQVYAYRYGSRGVHDVLIHEDGLMFTDSFRGTAVADTPATGGAIRFRGAEYLTEVTDAVPRKLVLRGLAVRDATTVVGYSAFAPRESRQTAGHGGVIVIDARQNGTVIDGPFAQVYDILPLDGTRSDRVGAPRSVEELDHLFRRDVGPLLYQAPVARNARLAALR